MHDLLIQNESVVELTAKESFFQKLTQIYRVCNLFRKA